MGDFVDYYKVLGVSRDAEDTDIENATKKLKIKYHPDRNPGDKVAAQKLKEVLDAYAVLTGSGRNSYDDEYDAYYGRGGTSYKTSSNKNNNSYNSWNWEYTNQDYDEDDDDEEDDDDLDEDDYDEPDDEYDDFDDLDDEDLDDGDDEPYNDYDNDYGYKYEEPKSNPRKEEPKTNQNTRQKPNESQRQKNPYYDGTDTGARQRHILDSLYFNGEDISELWKSNFFVMLYMSVMFAWVMVRLGFKWLGWVINRKKSDTEKPRSWVDLFVRDNRFWAAFGGCLLLMFVSSVQLAYAVLAIIFLLVSWTLRAIRGIVSAMMDA